MTDVMTGVLSALLLCIAFFCHPTRSECPHGWWIPEGVRRNGDFACRPAPVGDTFRDARGILRDRSTQPEGRIQLKVYCPPNAIPTLVDTSVLCTWEN